MLGIVKDNKIIPLTTDAGAGAPVGTLIQQYKKVPLSGYLYCDGSTFDENAYPALYMYLGTNVLPDYRECVMVGAEQNTTDTIAAHDVYGEGEFKDDQLETHQHYISIQSGGINVVTRGSGGNSTGWNVPMTVSDDGNPIYASPTSMSYSRIGETTHGKQKAVYVYIKATSGLAENQQDNVLNDVKEYVDSSNSYSTDEVKTGGKWIDGKPIYRKVVDVGTLPNATNKTVLHNIQNIDSVVNLKLIAKDNTNNIICNFGGKELSIYVDNSNIIIKTDNNFTGYTSYSVIEYTKTTD